MTSSKGHTNKVCVSYRYKGSYPRFFPTFDQDGCRVEHFGTCDRHDKKSDMDTKHTDFESECIKNRMVVVKSFVRRNKGH